MHGVHSAVQVCMLCLILGLMSLNVKMCLLMFELW